MGRVYRFPVLPGLRAFAEKTSEAVEAQVSAELYGKSGRDLGIYTTLQHLVEQMVRDDVRERINKGQQW